VASGAAQRLECLHKNLERIAGKNLTVINHLVPVYVHVWLYTAVHARGKVSVCRVVYKACKQRNGKIRRPGQSYNKRSVSLTTVQIWLAPIPARSNLRVPSTSIVLAPSLRTLKRATCPHRPRTWPIFRELVCFGFV